jgi:ArsR family transcriptional regulator, arsenate/arsenite/antimonite-responsive transcriptional repressor
MDNAFRALADPTRRRILQLLGERERTVNEIVAEFEISQPAISRHLAVLREAGLVTAVRKGQSVVYALDTTVVQDVVRSLLDLAATQGSRDGKRD